MGKNPLETLREIAQLIYDKKGINILALDVTGLSTITDYLLIAEGHVDRHVSSIGKTIVEEMKKKGEIPLHVEGLQTGDWVVIDFSGIMVHLFMPGYREKFSLEKLWKESKLVDLPINTSSTV
ncbi:MAG TPA: ribosome silencing factor [Parachlamydiales bacterium]|nr:ribosome silencing factor [Parachlamydiales bacterium]